MKRTLTRQEKAIVLEILKGSRSTASHNLVHATTDAEREFYRNLESRADSVIPLFEGKAPVEVEEAEDEEEEEQG